MDADIETSPEAVERKREHSLETVGSCSTHERSDLPSEDVLKKRALLNHRDKSFFTSVRHITGMSTEEDNNGETPAGSDEYFKRPSFGRRQESTLKMRLGRMLDSRSDELAERDHQNRAIKRASVVKSYPEFSFEITDLYTTSNRPATKLTLGNFTDISHLAFGSNAEVSLAKLSGDVVVIKLIKEDKADNSVAKFEFDMEQGILSKLDHPHIMKLFGSGLLPRKFLVLEWLGKGTLTDLLARKVRHRSFLDIVLFKPKIPLPEVYRMCIDLADAFDYLHRRLHPNAIIIHRDLKPDNVGFTSDGTLKLFDFGLCICVKRFTEASDSYDMSGNTGSLRYMAPEVALNKPYNEKVDVYSFFILFWQIATDRKPFDGANRKDFIKFVTNGGVRPDVPSHWPADLKVLVTSGWDPDPRVRPSFQTVVTSLRKLAGADEQFADV